MTQLLHAQDIQLTHSVSAPRAHWEPDEGSMQWIDDDDAPAFGGTLRRVIDAVAVAAVVASVLWLVGALTSWSLAPVAAVVLGLLAAAVTWAVEARRRDA